MHAIRSVNRYIYWIIPAFLLALYGCGFDGSAAAAQSLSAEQTRSLIEQSREDPDFKILDIRTPAEYEKGHIEGAMLIDFYRPDFKQQIMRLHRGKSYLIYCRSGNRSGKALRLINEMGFKMVYHLAGGILEWQAKNYPLTAGGAVSGKAGFRTRFGLRNEPQYGDLFCRAERSEARHANFSHINTPSSVQST